MAEKEIAMHVLSYLANKLDSLSDGTHGFYIAVGLAVVALVYMFLARVVVDSHFRHEDERLKHP